MLIIECTSSIINSMSASETTIKNSKTIHTPQQYVTVQIHNQNFKNKYRVHRSSVLNQLKNTENRLNLSLNKNAALHQSSFIRIKRDSTAQSQFKITTANGSKSKKRLQKLPQAQPEPSYRMHPDIKRKLKQLNNISYQLEKACEPPKKELKRSEYTCQMAYSLPVVQDTVFTDIKPKNIAQIEQQKKKWRAKIKMGKQCTQHLKQNPVLYNMLKVAKQQQEQINQSRVQVQVTCPKMLRDTYLQPIVYQRNTAPVKNSSSNFFNLFCSHKQEKNNLYDRKVELQPIVNLQQFANGGDQTPFRQYSEHINIKEFNSSKQKMNFLQKMYTYVKEKYGAALKELKQEELNEANLLSLVYYFQNSNNLTEQEKKNVKKKLKLIE